MDDAKISCVDLWWAVPGVLAGMSMPHVHPLRPEAGAVPIDTFDDELPVLWRVGIRGVVGLLNQPGAGPTFRAAGFDYCWLPITDGGVPTWEQFEEFLAFVKLQKATGHPVVAHCVAGLGRTGVLLAGYLVAEGSSPVEAVKQVREVRRGAVETRRQVDFLFEVEAWRASGQ
ncbi:MAG: protein-tyrosine phosphatase family protein [Verrucomicrobium sp.]